jgi:hypothetical protein
MHNSTQLKSRCHCNNRKLTALTLVSNGDHDPSDTLTAKARKVLATTKHRQARPRVTRTSFVLYECDRLVQPLLTNRVQHHTPMPAGAP